jgi:probable F420-dependent oxidoreductase
MATYLSLPNYTNNLRRFGFGDDDLADGGSDRLVDAIVAWGDEQAVLDRVRAHHDGGADHVALQVLPLDGASVPMDDWRRLSEALDLT